MNEHKLYAISVVSLKSAPIGLLSTQIQMQNYVEFYWWDTREGAEAAALKKVKELRPGFDSYYVSSTVASDDFIAKIVPSAPCMMRRGRLRMRGENT